MSSKINFHCKAFDVITLHNLRLLLTYIVTLYHIIRGNCDNKQRNCVVGRLLPTASARVSLLVQSIVLNQTMVAHPKQFILSFLLSTLAVATNNENPPYKFYCPTVGECSLIDVSKYHLYGEVSLTESYYGMINYVFSLLA